MGSKPQKHVFKKKKICFEKSINPIKMTLGTIRTPER
jgi:hypothetical protein